MRSRTVNLLQKVSITGLFVQIEQSREERKALLENKHEDKNKNKRKNSNIATFSSRVPDSIFYFKTGQSMLAKSFHWERLLHGSALGVVWAELS